MSIDPNDAPPLLAEVARFAQGRIAGAVLRPEQPIPIGELEQLTREALELGMLPTPDADAGFGLWESCDRPSAMEFNIGILRHTAHASIGVAFAWHRLALARHLERSLGFTPDAAGVLDTALVPTGHYGLARGSMARWLTGAEQQADERHLLADWLDRDAHATTVNAPGSWNLVLWPVWRDGEICWQRVFREHLDVRQCKPQHGFDGISAYRVLRKAVGGEPRRTGREASRLLYARIVMIDMIGLMAIGAGGIARGLALAKAYARIRKQGGKPIGGHPAVQSMLSDIERAHYNAEVALRACARPVGELDLGMVAASRATLYEALCLAADQVVQVHGAIGYMRDAGAEKILRDMNMLRLQAGGTREIRLFLAGWCGDAQ